MLQIYAMGCGYLEFDRSLFFPDSEKETELVLTGDACYTKENMDRNILPQVAWDEGEMCHALAVLRDLRDKKGASLFYGHDPGQWQEIRRAPEPLA